ncbi:glycosyltransferase family 39 protein [Pseudonocardia sp.]|uniref:glycosyltransferase family 39 protein n=1 Tax=Pseudonocardia sp. TaxID=60912 RepID=UPI003D0B66F1
MTITPPPSGPRHAAPPSRRRTLLAVGAVTLLAAVLRCWGLADKSLWIDEAFSLWLSTQDPDAIREHVLVLDKHPPLYYLLLHLWLAVAGDGEVALRSLSVVFGVATVPLAYLIGRDAGGRRVGLLAAALLAVSPLHVWYGQLGRMYAMLTFFAALATWCLVRLLTRGRTLGPADAAACWVGFGAATTLTMLSHNTAVLFPVAVAAFLAVRAVRERGRRDPDPDAWPTRAYALALGGGLLLWSVWLPGFLHQAAAVDDEFWLPAPTVAKVLEHVRDLVSARAPGELVVPLVLAAVALGGLGARRLRGRSGVALLLALLVVLPALGELVASVRRPVFYTQTLVWTAVPLLVLVAAGLLALRRRRVTAAALAVGALLAVNAVSLANYYDDPGVEDWRGAARYLAEQAEPGDLVIFDAAWGRIPFDHHYAAEGGPLLDVHGVPTELFERGELESKVTPADVPRLDTLVAGRPRVWVVYSHDWYTDPDRIVETRLAETLTPAGGTELRSIRIERYTGR